MWIVLTIVLVLTCLVAIALVKRDLLIAWQTRILERYLKVDADEAEELASARYWLTLLGLGGFVLLILLALP